VIESSIDNIGPSVGRTGTRRSAHVATIGPSFAARSATRDSTPRSKILGIAVTSGRD